MTRAANLGRVAPEVSFMAKTRPTAAGCLEWTAAQSSTGYGAFRGRSAARVAYEMFIGPIPEGLEPDHLCRNRLCVMPAHVELVTHQVNTNRGTSVPAINARKTHCKRGHEFTPENTGEVRIRGTVRRGRRCLECAGTRAWAAA